MSDLPRSGLDDRIRELVARAVADAPPAPTIDEHMLAELPMPQRNTDHSPDRTRWIAGGIAGLSIAAAVVALFFVSRPDDVSGPAPATVPEAAPRATAPSTGAPVPSPTIVPTETNAPVVGTAAPAVSVPTLSVPTLDEPTVESITVALPDGFEVEVLGEVVDQLVGYPPATAMRVPDGRVFFQRSSTEFPGVFVTDPEREVVEVPMPADIGTVRLHDAAVVDGEVVLVVESRPSEPCVDPERCIGSIWAVWPDSDAATKLDEQIVWEFGWSRLSLASTGVIVGETAAEVVSTPYSIVLPDVDTEPVDFTALGLEDSYVDCSECPRSFTIDNTGRYVGWIDPATGDGAGIVIGRIADGAINGVSIDPAVLPPFGALDLGNVRMDDVSVLSGTALVNDADLATLQAPLLFDLAGSLPPGRRDGAVWMAFGG